MTQFHLQNPDRIRQTVTDEFNALPSGQTLTRQLGVPPLCPCVPCRHAFQLASKNPDELTFYENPNGGEPVAQRTPRELLDEIATVLETIRWLL